MGLNTYRLGGNVDCWCGKCKMILSHTIEAMLGEKPARVHCNTCQSQHGYKAEAPATGRPATTSRKSTASRFKTLVMDKEANLIKAYSHKNKYELGDVLEHPQFGRGAVTAVKDPTKIEVLFENGSKTLVHAG